MTTRKLPPLSEVHETWIDENNNPYPHADAPSFDVTCILGTVVLGHGNQTPYAAALALIAEHDGPGTFTFPIYGRTITVVVDFGSLPGQP